MSRGKLFCIVAAPVAIALMLVSLAFGNIDNEPRTLDSATVQARIHQQLGEWFEIDQSTISPFYVDGDFRGDGMRGVAVLAKVKRAPTEVDVTKWQFVVCKPLFAGVDQKTHPSCPLLKVDLGRRVGHPVLIILPVSELYNTKTNGPGRPFVLLDVVDRASKTMTTHRGILRYAQAGDGPPILPPKLRGDAILILDDRGDGSAIYWDMDRYWRYPVSKEPPIGEAHLSHEELSKILAEAFSGLFQLSAHPGMPEALVGDFDGDGKPDLAMTVRMRRDHDLGAKHAFRFQLLKKDKTQANLSFETFARSHQGSWPLAIILGAGKGVASAETQRKWVLAPADGTEVHLLRVTRPGELQPQFDALLVYVPTDIVGVYWDGDHFASRLLREVAQ